MIFPRQRDLFGQDEQDELFDDQPTPAYRPDPDKVRRRLEKILAEARAAQKLPWESTTLSLYRTIFPQMTNWLPEDEGAQLRFAIRNGIGAACSRVIFLPDFAVAQSRLRGLITASPAPPAARLAPAAALPLPARRARALPPSRRRCAGRG